MATKSMILRPVGFMETGEAGMDTIIFPYSGVPDTTAAEDYYLLIRDEVADDNATSVTTGPSGNDLGVVLESAAMIPISGRVVVRANVNPLAEWVEIRLVDRANPTTPIYTQNFDIPYEMDGETKVAIWYTYVAEVTDVNALKSFLTAAEPVVIVDSDSSIPPSMKQYFNYLITQLYCEFEYSDGSSYYAKDGGAWAENSGTIYRKENGAWVEVEASALTEQTYVVQEL